MNQGIPEEVAFELLDLVVVSIASDIVPVIGENRVLAYFGLQKLNSNPSTGLKTIIKYAGLVGEIKINDIVFKIGPRLNASGRIEHGKKSVAILLAEDAKELDDLGLEINSYNEIRKTLDRDITQEALEIIEKSQFYKGRVSTVIYNRDWHKGVVGIVASRLTEYYYRPTVVLTESNGLATGSIDAKISLSDLSPKFLRLLNQFEPYGPHNMMPTFLTENVFDSGSSRLVGKNNEHLKLDLMEANRSSSVFSGIAFSQSGHMEMIKKSEPFDICYSVTENEYRGKTYMQLNVRDIKSRHDENEK